MIIDNSSEKSLKTMDFSTNIFFLLHFIFTLIFICIQIKLFIIEIPIG